MHMEQAKEMVRTVYGALEEKKGEDLCIIDISGISVIADYFVIATGSNDNQVKALVDNVDEKMEKAGYPLKQQEGQNSGAWVLLDYSDVIVHIFDKDSRSFYRIEHVWKDGRQIAIENL